MWLGAPRPEPNRTEARRDQSLFRLFPEGCLCFFSLLPLDCVPLISLIFLASCELFFMRPACARAVTDCCRSLHSQSPKLILPLSQLSVWGFVCWLVGFAKFSKEKNLRFYINILVFFCRFLDFGFCLEKTIPMIQFTFIFFSTQKLLPCKGWGSHELDLLFCSCKRLIASPSLTVSSTFLYHLGHHLYLWPISHADLGVSPHSLCYSRDLSISTSTKQFQLLWLRSAPPCVFFPSMDTERLRCNRHSSVWGAYSGDHLCP